MNKDHIIIALAGTSGVGKSTTISKLTELLDDATVIEFDDYTTHETYPFLDDISATYFGCPPAETPRDHEAWFKRGADLNEIVSPQLAEHLQALKPIPVNENHERASEEAREEAVMRSKGSKSSGVSEGDDGLSDGLMTSEDWPMMSNSFSKSRC